MTDSINLELFNLIPKSLRKHAYTICILAKSKSIKVLRNLLNQQSNIFFKALINISKNILSGNLKLNSAEKKKVKRFAGFLRKLVYKTAGFLKRRLLLNSPRGGRVVFIILKVLAPVLTTALQGVL